MTRVVIVGGGPVGYETALVAAQLGGGVTLLDFDGLGGSTVLSGIDTSSQVTAMAVDAAGEATIAGYTAALNFPTTKGSLQPQAVDDGDAFVARLSADGSTLRFSTYLGGHGSDQIWGAASA